MYLHVKCDDGIFKDAEISFDKGYSFEIVDDGITCRRNEELSSPQNFYAIGSSTPVDAVNVVVGKNGCGKTTLVRILNEIFSGRKTAFCYTLICRGSYPRVQGDMKKHEAGECWLNCEDDVEREVWLVHSFDKKGGLASKYADIEHEDEYVLKLKDQERPLPLQEHVDLVYFSPHFTTENPFRGAGGKMVNLSTAGLFVENPLSNYNRIQLASGVDSDVSIGAYACDERRRIMEFASAFHELDSERRKGVPFPMPIRASLGVDDDSLDRLRRHFHAEQGRLESYKEPFHDREPDMGYDELLRMCKRVRSTINLARASGLATQIIVGYVAAYCADSNLLDSYNGRLATKYGVALLDICDGEFKMLLEKTEKPQDLAVLDHFCRELVRLRGRSGGVTHSGSEYDKHARNALRFFLRLRKLVKRCPPEYSGTYPCLVVEISDEAPFRLLRDVVQWHRRLMESSTFIKINFAPKLSSGEMSYLTLYGRLASHFIYGGGVVASDKPKRDAVVFIDEAETTLHPLWQKSLLWNILWFFENFAKSFRVHLIFASHSPMLLSDVLPAHCIMLERQGIGREACSKCIGRGEMQSSIGQASTFAANIFDLYRSSFFMADGLVGKFAQSKLDDLMSKAKRIVRDRSGDKMRDDDWRVLESVGDPLAKQYFASVKALVNAIRK